MRINHNIAALNTHRQLNTATTGQSKSMEKLASGLRINKAGDDAAGLAISEKMRGQIRGLDQASKNSQDGISMIATAEGALNETHDILQRMRELATQASNDTNVGVDRGEIQKEINQLTSEINRVGNTTEFNTQSLLKGDGTNKLQSLPIDLSTIDTVTAGQDLKTTEAKLTVDLGAVGEGNKLSITVNGRTLDINFADNGTTGTAAGDITYDSTSAATINIAATTLAGGDDAAVSASTAEALQKLIDSDSDLKGNFKVTAAGGGALTIEAVKIGDFAGSKGNISWDATTAGEFTGSELVTVPSFGSDTPAIAAKTELDFSALDAAGVADLVGKGLTINGQQIEFYDANKGVYNGNATGINIGGLADGDDLATSLASQLKLEGITATADTAGNLTLTSNTKGAAGSVDVSNGGEAKKDFKASFQVGANQGQSMTIEIADMRSEALGITGKAGDKGFTSSNSVTDGTNSTNKEAALDVSNHENASAAIKVINDAIEKVSAQRSNLGASQNRLEHTINNLNTSSENLTAAESRIRDVDMAKEMMEQTKNSILSQAAQAMLAQANQQPQGVLQLLR